MNPQIDLSGLRDLHIPTQPSVWPLAYGWWVVGTLSLLALIFFFVARYLWRQRPIIYALHRYYHIATLSDDIDYLKSTSQLLRQVAIAIYGRTQIARLSDEKWQAFLIHTVPDTLTKDQAHAIAFAPYQPNKNIHISRESLDKTIPKWIKKAFKGKKSS